MQKNKLNKLIVILIVFMILFSNIGTTLSIAAENDAFEVINKGFFQKEEIKFEAYFENQDGKKTDKITDDVNNKVKLILDVVPELEGYLKEGTVRFVSEDDNDINFKITSVNGIEEKRNEEEILEEKFTALGSEDNKDKGLLDSDALTKANEEVQLKNPEELKNELLNALNTDAVNQDQTIIETKEILVNEEEFIEEKTEELKEIDQELILDILKTDDNEITLKNLVRNTRVIVELEYEEKENFDLSDLSKVIKVQLSGNFINKDLEEVKIGKENELTLEWTYSKDINLTSEYTKFSPFELEETKGTIVENKISVERAIESDKYLPVKSNKIEVTVPMVNGKKPTEVNVIANQLMLTRGEENGNVMFSKDNWKYDEADGKIYILVENDNLVNTYGIDEINILYRYEDFISEENQNLDKVVKVEVEEYSGEKNNVLTKEINEVQEVKTESGELISYYITTSEEPINKGKIYANYNSEEGKYETEYKTNLNVNILTSDVLEELKIDSTNEFYNTYTNQKLAAEGILNKRIEFNYNEIKSLLANGGEIVITNANNEILYKLEDSIINSQEDCLIELNNSDGLIIYIKNVKQNGNLNFEITKAIKKCNLAKIVFKDVKNIESLIKAEVKYQNVEERMEIESIANKTYFEESYTKATLSVDNKELNTIESNSNVQLKIQLNNDKETSDLYVNPVFEIVFPKYVKNVSVESINLLYENGLKVKDFKTYMEAENVKMRVELEGVQEEFSFSEITNGTNIVINVNIDVDNYTPKKEDQIKLYYINEGVTSYQTQTKWKISKTIPEGILKITNGFDAEIIKYNAPVGVIPVNGILNYDGNLSEVKSVKQGTVVKQIPINASSRIATMELLALNNGNTEISDLVLLGRIPVKGVKDVITNEDLNVNIDSKMMDVIKSDVANNNMVDIYYSENPEANKNLEDGNNRWNKEISDLSKIKSYLIVVNGNVKPGQVLRFTYDFNIPENLPYDSKIMGTFGTYFNNLKENSVEFESIAADKVGIKTEAGPKIEAKLTSNLDVGGIVKGFTPIFYKVEVKNTGSIPAKNLQVHFDNPNYTNAYAQIDDCPYGNNGYIVLMSEDDIHVPLKSQFSTIEELNPGEKIDLNFVVYTHNINSLEDYCGGRKDEKGYYKEEVVGLKDVIKETEEEFYNPETGKTEKRKRQAKEPIIEKVYYTEVPPVDIKAKAIIKSDIMANEIVTNELSNPLENSKFKADITKDFSGNLVASYIRNYRCKFISQAEEELKNVKIALNYGNIYKYNNATLNGEEIKGIVNEEEHKVYFDLPLIKKHDLNDINVNVEAIVSDKVSEEVDVMYEIILEDGNVEKTIPIHEKLERNLIKTEDVSVDVPTQIKEGENVIIQTKLENIGELSATNVGFYGSVDKSKVSILGIRANGRNVVPYGDTKTNNFGGRLASIDPKASIIIEIELKSLNLPGNENTEIVLNRKVTNDNQEDMELDPIKIEIENNLKTEKEKEQEEIKKYEEEQKKKEEAGDRFNPDKLPDINNGNNSNNNNNNKPNKPNRPINPENNSNSNGNNNSNSNGSNNGNNGISKPGNNINKGDAETANQEKYNLNGKVWIDMDKNGIYEDKKDETISGVNVYLKNVKNGNMVQSVTSGVNGKYSFKNLPKGKYVIEYKFDNQKYGVTHYKGKGSGEADNNDAVEIMGGEITARTNDINLESNIDNMDLGLIIRSVLDLKVNKYLKSVHVKTNKGEKDYEFNNEELAKIEIRAKEMKGAVVTLNYNVEIENVGDLEGYAEQLIDILPEDLKFNQEENSAWTVENDKQIHLKDVRSNIIKPGEKKEFKISLTKVMNPENTGAVVNKAILNEIHSNNDKDFNEFENKDNNQTTQTTLVFVSTGRTLPIITGIIIVLAISTIVYMGKNKVIKNKNVINKFNIKKNYK